MFTVAILGSLLALGEGPASGGATAAQPLPVHLQTAAADPPPAASPRTIADHGNLVVVRGDAAGGLWAGGYGGVVHWTDTSRPPVRYTVDDGLLDNWVFDFAVENDGTAWFGTASGLSRRDPDGTWSDASPVPPNPDDVYQRWAQAMLPAPDGSLWAAMGRGGLHQRTPDGRWQHFAMAGLDTGMRDDVRSLALAADGTLWLGGMTSGIVARSADGAWEPLVHTDLARVFRMAFGPDGSLWCASRRGLVRRAPDGTVTTYDPRTTEGAMPYIEVRDLAIDARSGDIWLAYVHEASTRPNGTGVSRFSPATGAWRTYTTADGLPDNRVTSVALDRAGELWVGTIGSGAVRLDAAAGRWEPAMLGDFERLPVPVQSVVQAPDGSIWIGGNEGAAQRRADGTWRRFAHELPHKRVNRIAFDADGNVWFATFGGIARWTPASDRWLHIRRADLPGRMPSNTVWWIEVDGANHVWAATQAGVVELTTEGQWLATHTSANTVDALRSNAAYVIGIDARGSVWVGTDRGLSRRSPIGHWESLVENFAVNAIAFERDDVIWIGGAGSGGARRYSADGFGLSMPIADALRDVSVQGIAIDARRRVWFATRRGIARLWPDGSWDHIDTVHGLASAWTNGLVLDPAAGDAWIATYGGVTRLPMTDDVVCPTANILASGATVGGEIQSPREVERYRFDVAEPYSTVTITLNDPSELLTLSAERSCNAIGSGTGRHIGSGTGRHIGPERTVVLPVDRSTGPVYLAVATGALHLPEPLPYQLSVTVRPPDPGAVNALLITDDAALRGAAGATPGTDAAWAAYVAARDRFLAAPHVRGRLVDVGRLDDAGLATARQVWLAGDRSPAAGNRYAAAIQRAVVVELGRSPAARAVVLVGDDDVLPHGRLPDHPEPGRPGAWAAERDYRDAAGIDAASAIGRALDLDLILSDDVFATADRGWTDGLPVPPPSWPVGRMVGTVTAVAAVLGGVADGSAPVALDRSLVAGWDFMDDAAAGAAAALGHGRAPQRHVAMFGSDWESQRLASLLSTAWPLTFLAMHADHRSLRGPDGGQVDAGLLATAPLSPGAVLTLACHSGLHVPDRDDSGGAGDLPEAWLGRQHALVGSSGWAYGMDGAIGYSERLMVDVVRGVAAGDDATLGDAVVRAKRHYHLTHPLDRYHYKTRVGTILFGVPLVAFASDMSTGGPPSAPLSATARPIGGAARAPAAAAVRAAAGDGSFAVRTEWRLGSVRPQRVDTPAGSYYSFSGAPPYAEAGQVLQPQIITEIGDIDLDARRLSPRGVVLVEARYREVPLPAPLVPRTGVLSAAAFRAAGAVSATAPDVPHGSGWQPAVLTTLRTMTATVAGGQVTEGRALWRFGQYHAERGVERLYHVVAADTLYSDSPDHTPPVVASVVTTAGARIVEVTIGADDPAVAGDPNAPSGVARVVLACDDGHGAWQLVEAAPVAGRWQVEVPASDSCLVQAIDGAGNVGGGDGAPAAFGPFAPQGRAWLPALAADADLAGWTR